MCYCVIVKSIVTSRRSPRYVDGSSANGAEARTACTADWSIVDQSDDRVSLRLVIEPELNTVNDTRAVGESPPVNRALGCFQFLVIFPCSIVR